MSDVKLHVDTAGSVGKPKTQSPKTINAWAQAREGFTRIVVAGIVLALLTIAYIVALFMKVEGAQNILLVIGSGMGFLLGRGSRNTGADE